ncbi:MAG: C4-dicarboxylate ABC transporter [Gammaproteobacteria bacterium]
MKLPSRISLLLPLFLWMGSSARGGIELNLESLSANGVHLEGIRLTLETLGDEPQPLQLTVNKIGLPSPFDVLNFFKLRCAAFKLDGDTVSCRDGHAQIASPWLDSQHIGVRFSISKAQSSLTLDGLQLGGGKLHITVHYAQESWCAKIAAQQLNAAWLQRLSALKTIAVAEGKIGFQADAQGHGTTLDDIRASMQVLHLNAQNDDGTFAAEKLGLDVQLQGRFDKQQWQWRNQAHVRYGALYIDPLYIAADEHALNLQFSGQWLPKTRQLRFDDIELTQPGLGTASGHALMQNGSLRESVITLQTDNLDKFAAVYIQPFLAATVWENLQLSGRLRAQAKLAEQQLTRLDVQFPRLDLSASEQHLKLHNGSGAIHWAHDSPTQASHLSWHKLHFYGLPFGTADLSFSSYGRNLRLNRPVALPLFDGTLRIGRFAWQSRPGTEPEVHFQGDIERVSLEKLTDTLHWPPLSGQISGNIPGLHYRNKQIDIDGALQIRIFDGEVRIEDLQLAGLLEGYPRFSADIDIDNLDLQQITRRFAFGGMQGRIAGFIRNLQLENWQPITFNAWLGTPDGDDSKHRISQKAVNNLATIGGGGATDFVSRSLLRVFDDFGYDKLGIGCYLQHGVCKLYGVAAAKEGFYIVKGGGLPRIDVIGYNDRIDWSILLQRLHRVLATDKAVVQ